MCVLSEISTTTGFEKPEICYLVYREALGRATSRHYTVRLQLHLLAFLSDLHPLFIFTLSSDWLSSWSQNGDQQQPEWRQASLWMASWRGEIDFLPLWNATPFPSSVCSNLVTCLSQPTTNTYQAHTKCLRASQDAPQAWIQLPLNHMGYGEGRYLNRKHNLEGRKEEQLLGRQSAACIKDGQNESSFESKSKNLSTGKFLITWFFVGF